MKRSILFFVALLLLIAACTSTQETPEPPEPEQPEIEAQAVEPAEEATPTTAPSPTPTPEPIAPLVLRTGPELGQEQPLDAPLEITFDQPMERDSVEKAFAIEPGASVDGTFEWDADYRTVRFALKDGFERGQRYKVRVVESARSEAGLEMQRPFELRFNAVGFLEVTGAQPANGTEEILPDTVVTVLFNRPVVPLKAIENLGSLPDPLTFVPPVKGEGEWLNTSIYQFTPDGGFEPATEYSARVGKGLTDALGGAELVDDYKWSFTTVTPAVVAGIPAGGDIYVSPSPVISLAFNQPMDRASVEENFLLANDNTGETVSGSFYWIDDGLAQPAGRDDFDGYYDYEYAEGEGPEKVGVETLEFTPDAPLDFDGIYQIQLPKGTAGAIGNAVTSRDFVADFTVIPYPAVTNSYPASGDTAVDPWTSLQISFNSPTNPDSVVVGENLIIRPTVAATQVFTYWWSSNTELEINFPTEAGRRYAVTLGDDIEGRYGQPLDKKTTVLWETRAQSPQIFLHSPGRIATYNAYTETVAYISARNLGLVNFGLYQLGVDDFVRLNGNNWWEEWDTYRPNQGDLVAEWKLAVAPELNDTLIYKVPIGEQSGLGNPLPPGLYYLEATVSSDDIYPEAKDSTGQYNLLPERQMMVVSNRNLTYKSSNHEGLAWLTDLQSGRPVGGVEVMFLTTNDEGEATTDADGVATYTYRNREDPFDPYFVFAGDPQNPDDDFAVAAGNWSDGIERYQFDNVNVEDYPQPYNSVVYTDRKIYRPGQTVYFKGILRADDDAQYSMPAAAKEVLLTIRDGQGKEIYTDSLPLSEVSTFNGSIELDENAGLGNYSMELVYGDDYYFYGDFQVAAYRKPEFLVTAETDKPEYANGDQINVTVDAQFFFGGPVSNAEVSWTLLSSDYSFQYTPPSGGGGVRGGYDFVDYDSSRGSYYFSSFGETLAEGSGVTDADGRFTFSVDADIADKLVSQRFTFDVAITDINNQEVAGQAGAVVHKGLFYVGLNPVDYVGVAGKESEVNVLVVDWQSEPVAGQEVEIVFAEHNWYSAQKQYDDGSFYWDSVSETIPVFTTTVTSDSDGKAIAAFTPESGGVYKIMAGAGDSRGNTVRSSTFMWVSGREYVNWRQENNDRLELVANQREYDVGDTATILVPHPYSGTVQALVTLERGHIYEHFVTELPTNSEQLEIPITAKMAPNMYVSVVVVQGSNPLLAPSVNGGGTGGVLPGFKVGYAGLPINTGEKELQITLTPNPPLTPPRLRGERGGATSPATPLNML